MISISLRLYVHFSSNGFLMFSGQAASMYLDVCGLKMNRKLGSKSTAVWLGGGREDFFPLGYVHLFPLKRSYGYPASSKDRNRIGLADLVIFLCIILQTIILLHHLMIKLNTKPNRKKKKGLLFKSSFLLKR